MKRDMTLEEAEEIRECNPEGIVECYCDNTHEQNHTVCNLVDCEWGGDAAADCIALELTEANEEIQRLFDYLALKNSGKYRRETIGFEVHVEEDQAREWLRVHRPEILSLPALKRYPQIAS